MNLKGLKVYDLETIASWQLRKQEDVHLPPLQRSFVWRPGQIENLWDSLFRGYPIGSFLLSQDKTKASKESLELLDGQQRSTSIFLGFYNAWLNEAPENLWKLPKDSLPILWFDLSCLNNENETSKFLFRVITKSHPWGYQKSDNTKILLTPDITKAIAKYGLGEKRYFNTSLKNFWPWDSKLPVPLSFILESYLEHHEKDKAYNPSWTNTFYKKCSAKFKSIVTKGLGEADYLTELDLVLKNPECNKHLYVIIHNLMSREIPALLTPPGYLRNNYDDQHQATGTEVDAEDTLNLFVRVNSGGTPLAGEELIFSMYKSYYPDFQEMIQKRGVEYIRPSRILTFSIKMAHAIHQDEVKKIESPGKTKVRDFKRFVKDEGLMKKLKGFIDSLNKSDIFSKAKDIISGSESFQLSYASLTNLAESSPDVFFILLYRIYKDDIPEVGSEEHKKVIGFLTALAWFGKSEKQNSSESVLRHIWNNLIEAKKGEFWNSEIVLGAMRAKDAKVKVPQMIDPDMLRAHLLEHAGSVRLEELKTRKIPQSILDFYNNEAIAVNSWSRFVKKLMQEKNLILYSQKKFIDLWFKEHIMTDLEDTNVPWDWDHIYPTNMTKNINSSKLPFLMDWHSSNGNYRAWPYELNRGDGDKDPSSKFRMVDQGITNKYLKADEIFEASAIKSGLDWNLITNKCETDEEILKVQNVVINRLCDLYKHWYDTLKISEIFPSERANLIVKDSEAIANLIDVPLNFKKPKIVEDNDDEFELWYRHENLAEDFTLVYYVDIDKKNLLHTDSDDDIIGLFIDLKDPNLSKSALKMACGKNTKFKVESWDNGAIIYKTTAYKGLNKKLSRELQEFIDETRDIYANLVLNNQLKKAS